MYDPHEYPIEPDLFQNHQYYVLDLRTGMVTAAALTTEMAESWIAEHGSVTKTYTIVEHVTQMRPTHEVIRGCVRV